MTLAELRAEFFARGFDYLNDGGAGQTRADRWLNQAYLEIAEMDDWPWLENLREGVSVVDGFAELDYANYRVGTVRYVRDTTNGKILRAIDPRDVAEVANTDQTGTPEFFWIARGVLPDDVQLNVFPRGNITVELSYYETPAMLTTAGAEPLIPERYQYAIVDYAAARAYLDSDNPEYSSISRSEGDRLVGLMRDRMLFNQHQDPGYVTLYGNSEDG